MNLLPASVKQMFADFRVDQHMEKCKSIAKGSMDELSPADYKVLDDLLNSVPELVSQFQKHAKSFADRAKKMDVEDATALMQEMTDLLKKQSTVDLIERLVDQHGHIVKSPRPMKAIGNYLRCVLSSVDDQYKEAAMAAFDLVVALIGLVGGDPKVREFANDLGSSLKANVVKPVANEMKQVQVARNANNGSKKVAAANAINGSNALSPSSGYASAAGPQGNAGNTGNAYARGINATSKQAYTPLAPPGTTKSSVPSPYASTGGAMMKKGSSKARKSGGSSPRPSSARNATTRSSMSASSSRSPAKRNGGSGRSGGSGNSGGSRRSASARK